MSTTKVKQGKEHNFQANVFKIKERPFATYSNASFIKMTLTTTRTCYLMEQDLLSSVSQAGVVNGAAIDLMVMGGVMWGSACWSVSRYSMSAT
jgi:hypothetical protein